MVRAFTLPVFLHVMLQIRQLKFEYTTSSFGLECEARCVKKVSEWGRRRVPPQVYIEIPVVVGSYCPQLCSLPDSSGNLETSVKSRKLVWSGFEKGDPLRPRKPYICTFFKDNSGICGYGSSPYMTVQLFNINCG